MKIVKFAEIEPLLKAIKNFSGENLYTQEYTDDSFFVLYENDAVLENLHLDNYIDNQFIEGYIFKKNLEVNKQIYSFDTDYSPFLVVLGNVKSPQLTLAGNDCYIGGNLECNTLWGIYNHGSLTVNGSLKTQLLYSDEFAFEFGSINEIAFILGDERANYQDENGLGLVLMTKSHSLKQVFNSFGQVLCDNGLFQHLANDDENQPQIFHTEFDFYENFTEKVRPAFKEIFDNSLFDNQEIIEIESKNPEQYNIVYSYTKTEMGNAVVIINRNRNYTASIVLDNQTDVIMLNLALFDDTDFKQMQLYFEMNEQDVFFQAKTVKHWFFEAVEEWQLNKNAPKNTHEFIEELKQKDAAVLKMPFENGTEKIFDYIGKPDEIFEFLNEYLDTFPETSELFGYILRFLYDETLLEKLVDKALAILEKEDNPNAHAITFWANGQVPEIFHTKLQTYFTANPNALKDNSYYPWRNTNMVYVQPFKDKITNSTTSIEEKERYFKCLYNSKQNNIEREHLISVLQQSNFEVSAIEKIKNFYPKLGFDLPGDGWGMEQIGSNLLPIMYDNANYLCVYKEGVLRGKVCEWHHEESNFAPMWKSINSLFATIENEPECDDWIELSRDFPLTDETFTEDDQTILDALHKTYSQVKNYEEDFENNQSEQSEKYSLKLQTVFTICEMTPPKKIAELVPFLNDKDMFVLERVISTLGENNYYPAKDKVIEIAKTSNGNQKMAAESVLKDWEEKNNKK